MKYTPLLLVTLLLAACHGCQPLPEKNCPTGFVQLGEQYNINACLTAPDAFMEAQDNYNDESYGSLIQRLEVSLRARDMKIPKLEKVSVVITDVESFYNEAYVFYLPPTYQAYYGDVFDSSSGFYVSVNNAIYVNLSNEATHEPDRIVLHELLHLVSLKNYHHQDHKHELELLWKEITQEVLMKN